MSTAFYYYVKVVALRTLRSASTPVLSILLFHTRARRRHQAATLGRADRPYRTGTSTYMMFKFKI